MLGDQSENGTLNDNPAEGEQVSVSKFEARLQDEQASRKVRGIQTAEIPLAWKNLSIRGIGGVDDVVYHPDLGTLFAPWITAKAKKRAAKNAAKRAQAEGGLINEKENLSWVAGMPTPRKGGDGLKKGERYILKDFSGVLQPGEMMLVVGRPGSGCSTFLKALSDLTDAYAGKEGEVLYGDMKAGSKEFKRFRSLVCFNSEEDTHDPNLTVGRTMDFATRNELVAEPARPLSGDHVMTDNEYQQTVKMNLLNAFNIGHTHNTKVGNQYVRGVSGGERKRVSLAEALSADAAIYCWDNATRGLDASTALDYTRVCRSLCDVQKKINVVSLYQGGNSIYELFDKVTVIAEGRVIYYGPRIEARPYFESLGFRHMDGANTADYLTAVTALAERRILPGFDTVPNTSAEFSEIYRKSDVAARMQRELDEHLRNSRLADLTRAAKDSAIVRKNKGVPKGWPMLTSFPSQVKAALIREYQQRWGDQWSFWGRQLSTFVLAFITGSVFYSMPENTGGLFLRGGVIFSTLVLPIILAFSDVQVAFQGRAVMAKHKAYSMYRPAAIFIAQTLTDLPIFFVQIALLDIIVYFLSGLQVDAGKFFIFFLASFTLTVSITALFRAAGYAMSEYNNATKITGGLFTAFVLYSGFVIYNPAMHPWFSWIRWLNPIYYMVEMTMVTELTGITFACAPPQLAPYGPGYINSPAACAITGAEPGTTFVTGSTYLDAALDFSHSHVWRNWGITIAWTVTYIVLGCIAIESIPAAGATKGVTLYKTGGGVEDHPPAKEADDGESANGTTFTWKDIDYVVRADGKDKQLLDKVSGYCKAGTLTALMGSSGAGKTTLMDVLAARKDDGVITGEVKLNGYALPISFQRTTGYCEQLDVHLPTATVKEALQFSALLRQPRRYSREEKLAYVDTIIDLLELNSLADALVGSPGAGLGVEQRKRLTIGVELVSRPTLLFLDEPTSGLDGQSSYMILQFLRKLAARGQSVLCTIHQPSAALFAEFDQLLLLKGGGKTVYFGSVDGMPQYFGEQGVPFPKDANPAEYMIDVVSGSLSQGKDWAKVWVDSPDRAQRMEELEQVKAEAAQMPPVEEDGSEFAAPLLTQVRLVCARASVQLYRDTEYVMNKVMLHISTALLVGFSYWMIGESYADLQNRLFAVFNFVFVAPGVMVQTQPKFIANRDIFEKREKKAKLYSWVVFCIGEIVAEFPYLVICAVLFWCCWYATAGLDLSPGAAGPVVLTMIFYEFLYTGIAQFIAAYAPNPAFAALTLPVVIGVLVTFSGVLIPYAQLTTFWKYWIYWLNPFTYLTGALLVFVMWDVQVQCKDEEYGIFEPPSGQTCGQYMEEFLQTSTGYLRDPDATSDCGFCGYSNGREYLSNLNLKDHFTGWRNTLITLLFCLSSYGLVFLLLKLRSKKSKTAQ